jgi:hypothetical protein
VFQAFRVPESAIATMLGAIKNRKFFLQTGFGKSSKFASGEIPIKMQGLTQENGVSPAGWALISMVILNAHGKKGHSIKFTCPITKLISHISAILYINDTNLLHINLDKDKSVTEFHSVIQNRVLNWGNLLVATGRALQPAKCFYYITSFEWHHGK